MHEAPSRAWGRWARPSLMQEHRSALHDSVNMQLSTGALGADDGRACEQCKRCASTLQQSTADLVGSVQLLLVTATSRAELRRCRVQCAGNIEYIFEDFGDLLLGPPVLHDSMLLASAA